MEPFPPIQLTRSFNDLRQLEFALVGDLNRLRDIARRLHEDDIVDQIGQVLQAITSHSFSIAVVGEFKRGKSTFINALLGREILPSDIAPTSATLNRVSYGLTPRALVQFKGADGGPGRVEEIPIEQLADYVTKLTPEAEALAAQIHEAIVYYPVPYCQNNVSIIDTPGMNDTGAMSAVTRSVLPQVDAAIMVMMPNSPLAGTEGAFLNELLANDLGKVLFVVTGIDKVPRSADRERLLARIRDRIKQAIRHQAAELYPDQVAAQEQYQARVGEPKVFGLSGYDALQAKQTNDGALLTASGFTEFEQGLERFLSEERGAVALKVIADRVSAIAEKLSQALDAQRAQTAANQHDRAARYTAVLTSYEQFRHAVATTLEAVNQGVATPVARFDGLLASLAATLRAEAERVMRTAPLTVDELNKASVAALGSAMQQGSQGFFDAVNRHLPEKVKDPGQNLWRQATDRMHGGLAGSLQSPHLDAALAQLLSQLQTELSVTLSNTSVILRYEIGRQSTPVQGLNTFIDALIEAVRQATDAQAASSSEVAERYNFLTRLAQESAEALDRKRDYALRTLQALTETLLHEIDLSQFCLKQSQRALLSLGQARNLLQPAERVELYRKSYLETVDSELQRRLDEIRLAARYREQVTVAFDRLAQHVQSVATDVEQQSQALLQLLRDQAERAAVRDEQLLLKNTEMQTDGERIGADAKRLTEHLAIFMRR